MPYTYPAGFESGSREMSLEGLKLAPTENINVPHSSVPALVWSRTVRKGCLPLDNDPAPCPAHLAIFMKNCDQRKGAAWILLLVDKLKEKPGSSQTFIVSLSKRGKSKVNSSSVHSVHESRKRPERARNHIPIPGNWREAWGKQIKRTLAIWMWCRCKARPVSGEKQNISCLLSSFLAACIEQHSKRLL